MQKNLFLTLYFLLCTCLTISAQSLSIDCDKPGKLSKLLKGNEDITALTITGTLNGKDLEAIYALTNLNTLNLQHASLLGDYTMTLGEGKEKSKKNFSEYVLYYAPQSPIKNLYLPVCIESVEPAPKPYTLDNLYLITSRGLFGNGIIRQKIAKNIHLDYDWPYSSCSWDEFLEDGAKFEKSGEPVIDTLFVSHCINSFEIEDITPRVLVCGDKTVLVRWTGNKSEITREDLKGFDAIAYGAFAYHTEIDDVSIPANITQIPPACFWGLGLRSITMDAVKKIGEEAFRALVVNFNMTEPPLIEGGHYDDGILQGSIINIPAGTRKQYQLGEWKREIVHAEDDKTDYDIVVETPGTLSKHITKEVASMATSLTLTGVLYDTDIDILNKCTGLNYLDLTRTLILESPETAKRKNEELEGLVAMIVGLSNIAAESSQHAYEVGYGNLIDAIGTTAIADYFNQLVENTPKTEVIPSKECLTPEIHDLKRLRELRLPLLLKYLGSGISGLSQVKKIVFPPALEIISPHAFDNDLSLDSLILPKSVIGFDTSYHYHGAAAEGYDGIKVLDLSKTQITEIPELWLHNAFGEKSSIREIRFPKNLNKFNLVMSIYSKEPCDIYIPNEECEGSVHGRNLKIHIPKGCKAGWTEVSGTLIDDL